MSKKIVINSCDQCPRHQYARGNADVESGAKHTCAINGRLLPMNFHFKLFTTNTVNIPDWCPLEDNDER